MYTGVACPEMKKNSFCPRGDACTFAHNVFEYWLHPSRYRTQLCNDGVNCPRKRGCFFAHSLEELRQSSVKVMSPEVTYVIPNFHDSASDGAMDPFFSIRQEDMTQQVYRQQALLNNNSPTWSPTNTFTGDIWDQMPTAGISAVSSRGSSRAPGQHVQRQTQRMLPTDINNRPQAVLVPGRMSGEMQLQASEGQVQQLQLAAMQAQLRLQHATTIHNMAAEQQRQQQQMQQQHQQQAISVDQLTNAIANLQVVNGMLVTNPDQIQQEAVTYQQVPVPPQHQQQPPQQLQQSSQQQLHAGLAQALVQQIIMKQQQQQDQVQQQVMYQIQPQQLVKPNQPARHSPGISVQAVLSNGNISSSQERAGQYVMQQGPGVQSGFQNIGMLDMKPPNAASYAGVTYTFSPLSSGDFTVGTGSAPVSTEHFSGTSVLGATGQPHVN
ncbi:hypothetical protein CEUSTIGMA_g3107.t1 [Chlamydomonas eustigma]|uniref:C3H1-type domain-containing protein n=1 Tax=Chlamydomonas eustigma TaxID=1157962 RepID=A0A250WXU9_9CHLO|nr:hypothetical protein CEUSTIGMA_g3107.t1 [Chlamydomonas eustigma]|eukprot:GAX75663.1 hypothetical protein CEUSTIGMA_g3107.t1 [Chlamydomonas eustigma]